MIGTTFGPLRILDLLGRGGMGEVYLAEDTRLARHVALKLPVPHAGAATDGDELLSEARAAAALNHPNVCTVHEVGIENGRHYIVMEYIDGKPLSSRIGVDGMPVETVCELGTDISAGLAAAHERGLVHRDLKPANVMITADGRAKILDFGLATGLAQAVREATQTRTVPADEAIAGTLPYMAPETLRGETPDPRSDIWALGVMLYEMTTGRRPFVGTSAAELTSAILRDRPAALPAGVPAGLDRIILRCLRKDPSRRYQRATEIRAALEVLDADTDPRAAFPTPRSSEALAVLPLESLSSDREQEYFADGMTDALIAELSKLGALKVISRTSIMQYKGARGPLRDIAGDLGVEKVIEGTVLRAGERVRITTRLVDATSDEQLWAESYEDDLRDVLALQGRVAREVSAAIHVVVRPEENRRLEGHRRVDPQSHDAYLKGLYNLHRWGEDGLGKALQHFQWAIEIDPTNARAYAGVADCHCLQGVFGLSHPKECLPIAERSASKALEIDPDLGEAHSSLATTNFLYRRDWARAEAGYRRALELSPGNSVALQGFAFFLIASDRADEGLELGRRAVELDPLANTTVQHLAFLLFNARRYDESLERLERAFELDPNLTYSHATRIWDLVKLGRHDEAQAAAGKALELAATQHDAYSACTVGWALAGIGERDTANGILEQVRSSAAQRWVDPGWIGLLHEGLGQRHEAIDCLRRAEAERAPSVVYWGASPLFDSLRDDEGFQELVRRTGP